VAMKKSVTRRLMFGSPMVGNNRRHDGVALAEMPHPVFRRHRLYAPRASIAIVGNLFPLAALLSAQERRELPSAESMCRQSCASCHDTDQRVKVEAWRPVRIELTGVFLNY
jgi:hypothetical protein